MTNYNDGKWHGWNGGKCPVHPKSEVEIQTYGDDGGCATDVASSFLWGGEDVYGNRIIAFRVIEEHKEPREFWVFEDELGFLYVGPSYEHVNNMRGEHKGRAFKAREVLE